MTRLAFHDPIWLLALLALPVVIWLRGRRRIPVLLVPFAAAWHRPSLSAPSRWPATLAILGLILLVVALSRPQRVEDKREVRSEGYDIILAIDLSTSMRAEDYEKGGERMNRLQAIKPVIQAFIERRSTDRIGIVLFSGRAYTMAPLTFDHEWLARQLERIRIGMIEDGTAIGDGLGVSLTRLEQAKRESGGKRIGAYIVLLTDGANNRGTLTPPQAAELAKSRGVPIYTIGAGKDGYVPVPVYDENNRKMGYRRMLSDLDETSLREIAEATGGKFFRAFDTDTIESAFKAIDRAQKIEFQAKSYLITTELFWRLAGPGTSLLLLGAIFAVPALRSVRDQFGRSAADAAALRSTPNTSIRRSLEPPTLVPLASKPGVLLLVSTGTLVALNMWLGFAHGVRASGNTSNALGQAVAQLLMPGVVALLFSISKGFRNARSRTKVVFWTSLVILLVKFASPT